MSGTIINAKNPSNVYQPLNLDASGRLECSVNEIEITAGDISVAVDGLEGLQTTANSTLGNIYSRQDDILTSCNATKLTNDTIATKVSSLQSTNHTDLDNIHSRQDDILTSCNATKLTNDTIATKTSALLTANHTDLNNIYTRQDDILTSSNAIKTNTQSLENCVSSNKVNVNISSGAISGFATQSTLNDAEVHLGNIQTSVQLIDDVVGTDGSAGPSKCISIGGTNPLGGAIQEIAVDGDGHLSVDILSSALPSGAAGEISNTAIATKATLATSAEVKELLSGDTINAGALSSELDTENYERVRFFGITTASTGTDIILMGSNVSGGVFYVLGENLRSDTIGGVHYVYGAGTENLPRYIKLLNKSASNNYVFTKLYLQGSGGRLLV